MENLSYMQKWYQNNKEKHHQWCTEKIKCDRCDSIINRSNWWNHLKTKRHLNHKKKGFKKIEKNTHNSEKKKKTDTM
jgi:hypothetical protein